MHMASEYWTFGSVFEWFLSVSGKQLAVHYLDPHCVLCFGMSMNILKSGHHLSGLNNEL